MKKALIALFVVTISLPALAVERFIGSTEIGEGRDNNTERTDSCEGSRFSRVSYVKVAVTNDALFLNRLAMKFEDRFGRSSGFRRINVPSRWYLPGTSIRVNVPAGYRCVRQIRVVGSSSPVPRDARLNFYANFVR